MKAHGIPNKDAESLLKAFQRAPNIFGACSLIKFAKEAGDLEKAFEVYRTLLAAGVPPDAFIIAALVNAARHCGQPGRQLRSLLDDVHRFRISLDGPCTHILVAACGESRDADSARWLLAKLKILLRSPFPATNTINNANNNNKKVVKVGPVDCTNLCKALVAEGDVASAFEVLDLMMGEWRVPPNAITFSVILPSCGDLKQGKKLHSLITKRGIHIDDVLGAALISTYSRCGDLRQAAKVFESICPPPGVNSWTAIMRAHAKEEGRNNNQHQQKVLDLFEEMLARGITPTADTLLPVLSACGELGDVVRGSKIHHSFIIERGIHIDDVLGAALISMYSKCGEEAKALAVFAAMDETSQDVASWSAVIGVHSKKKREKTKTGGKEEVYSRIIKKGIPINDVLGTALISMYSKREDLDLDRALDIFNAIEATSRGVGCWSAIIAAHVAAGESKKTLSLFEEMLAAGVAPDEVTFLSVLPACGDDMDLQKGKEIHSLIMKTRKGMLSYHLETALISMYGKCGDLDRALAVFNAIDAPSRSVGVWNAIIGGHVKQGKSRDGLSLFDDMLAAEVTPNELTFSSVLPACGQLGAQTKGMEIHSLIVKNHIPINDHLGAALISMYGRTGALEEAIALFSEIWQRRTQGGSVSSWTAMIGAYGDHRRTKEALKLFETIAQASSSSILGRDETLKPTPITLCAALSACSHAGEVDRALELVASMESRFGIPPDTFHHSCIVDTLGRAGRLQEAEDYLLSNQSDSDTDSLRDQEVLWMTLLGACRIHGDVKRAKRIEQRIRKLGISSVGGRAAAWVLMSDIYASAGQWESKDRVRQQMKAEAARKLPGISCVEVQGRVHEFVV